MSRPLYVYVKVASAVKPEVKAFIDYIVAEQGPLAEEALFVPLAADQLANQAAELAKVDAT